MKRQILIFLVVVPFASSLAILLIGLIMLPFGLDEVNTEDIIILIVSFVIFVIFSFFLYALKNQYKLKYFFSMKKFKKLLNESLKKFNGADETFIKEYIDFCKTDYRRNGNIDLREFDYSVKIYTSTENIPKIKLTFELLLESIKTRNGFLAFFDDIRENNVGDEYEIYRFIQLDMMSNEFKYLIFRVFSDTHFNLHDNGFSKQYSVYLQNVKEKTERVYTPILFNFYDEIDNAIKIISKQENGNLNGSQNGTDFFD